MQTNVKSSVVAGILGVFLGAFGGHDWYLGNTKKAITHVCLCVGGFILLMIGLILASLFDGITALRLLSVCIEAAAFVIILGNGIWGFIEGVIIIAQGDPGLAAKGYKVAVPASATMQMNTPVVASGDAVVPVVATAQGSTEVAAASVAEGSANATVAESVAPVVSESAGAVVAAEGNAGAGAETATEAKQMSGEMNNTGNGGVAPAAVVSGSEDKVTAGNIVSNTVEKAKTELAEPITPAPENPNVITANPAADSVMQATVPTNKAGVEKDAESKSEALAAEAKPRASMETVVAEPKVTMEVTSAMQSETAQQGQEPIVTQAIADPTLAETAKVNVAEVKPAGDGASEKPLAA